MAISISLTGRLPFLTDAWFCAMICHVIHIRTEVVVNKRRHRSGEDASGHALPYNLHDVPGNNTAEKEPDTTV